MLELKVGRLLELNERLIIERGHFERARHEMEMRTDNPAFHMKQRDYIVMRDAVAEVEHISRLANLESTRVAAHRTGQMFTSIGEPPANSQLGLKFDAQACRSMFNHLMDITSRIRDDCSGRLYFQIAPEAVRLYQPNAHFGEDVERVFPIAIDDIAEAGKCLALGLGTATVFHLMRVMEAGLRALAAELGIPYAPSWEAYKKQLDKILDANNYGNLSADQRAKRPFYQDALGDVVAIKTAWRNPTMHIVKTYDTKQAMVVWSATESFMKHVAANLSPTQVAVISTGQVS